MLVTIVYFIAIPLNVLTSITKCFIAEPLYTLIPGKLLCCKAFVQCFLPACHASLLALTILRNKLNLPSTKTYSVSNLLSKNICMQMSTFLYGMLHALYKRNQISAVKYCLTPDV